MTVVPKVKKIPPPTAQKSQRSKTSIFFITGIDENLKEGLFYLFLDNEM